MALLAIPNVSVGAPGQVIEAAEEAVAKSGARLLDVHSDAVHNRSVLTATGSDSSLATAMVGVAKACQAIDLTEHVGVHPRVGALDVCPFVPHNESIDKAIAAAHRTGRAIAEQLGAPVFFYGDAATRAENKELPSLRLGGLDGLIRRMKEGFEPDEGPSELDPRYGAVLVGARGPLVAFNVWLESELEVARKVTLEVRRPSQIRALALEMNGGRCQVSMNLTAPDQVSVEDAFTAVERSLRGKARIIATEIVGLVEQRYLPDPDAKVARLLMEPGHSLESALDD
ncbi:MAG: hypothetical protein LC808_11820 [Actinobacteria bacterium]|nr:hypothetical protein [Actinomycetota bacterium]